MASGQVPLKPNPPAAPAAPDATTLDSLGGGINVPASFQICPVDTKYHRHHDNPHAIPSAAPVEQPAAPLGFVLENFTGCYRGKGFNLIFRPNNGVAKQNTNFPNPMDNKSPIGEPPNEQVLELNVTQETIHFSKPLGTVPNRGLETQGDIMLNGVPYLQSVSDVLNPASGKADGQPNAIHFEPGLWMHVPATDNENPKVPESLCRMASIPHGTTINAQGPHPTQTFPGGPKFAVADPTPFPIGNPGNPLVGVFHSLDVHNPNTPRIPQDLKDFLASGTITPEMLADVNSVLRNDIGGQNIINTIVFKVSAGQSDVANIDFLEGTVTDAGSNPLPPGPNANVPSIEATFWIETVQTKITVPPFKKGHPAIHIAPKKGENLPIFVVQPPKDLLAPTEITVTFKQIQYSQTVLLNFATLSWPHISVATLVQEYTHVPESAFL